MKKIELLNYIKSMRDPNFSSVVTKEMRNKFAQKCGTTFGYLLNIAYGHKPCNPSLAIEIDKHSNGAVRAESLTDADFQYLFKRNKRYKKAA